MRDPTNRIAAYIYDMWEQWTKELAATEQISPKRRKIWEKCWGGYDLLAGADKIDIHSWAYLIYNDVVRWEMLKVTIISLIVGIVIGAAVMHIIRGV